MEEETKPEALQSRGGCWFCKEAVSLHIGVDPDFVAQKEAHPGFAVAGLEDLAARLAAAGYPVQWDEGLPDRKRFFTADPFGNRIEFLELR